MVFGREFQGFLVYEMRKFRSDFIQAQNNELLGFRILPKIEGRNIDTHRLLALVCWHLHVRRPSCDWNEGVLDQQTRLPSVHLNNCLRPRLNYVCLLFVNIFLDFKELVLERYVIITRRLFNDILLCMRHDTEAPIENKNDGEHDHTRATLTSFV